VIAQMMKTMTMKEIAAVVIRIVVRITMEINFISGVGETNNLFRKHPCTRIQGRRTYIKMKKAETTVIEETYNQEGLAIRTSSGLQQTRITTFSQDKNQETITAITTITIALLVSLKQTSFHLSIVVEARILPARSIIPITTLSI